MTTNNERIDLETGFRGRDGRSINPARKMDKVCGIVCIFVAFTCVLVGAIIYGSAGDSTTSSGFGLFRNNSWACRSKEISTKTHSTAEIRSSFRLRQYSPGARLLRKTAPLLDQGSDMTCFLAAVARTVARISIWQKHKDNSVSHCFPPGRAFDFSQYKEEIWKRADKIFRELQKRAEEHNIYYRHEDGTLWPRSDNLTLQFLLGPKLRDLWNEYLDCECLLVVPVWDSNGILLHDLREQLGVSFGAASYRSNVGHHVVCIEEIDDERAFGVDSSGGFGTPQYPDIVTFIRDEEKIRQHPAPSCGPAERALTAEILIAPCCSRSVAGQRLERLVRKHVREHTPNLDDCACKDFVIESGRNLEFLSVQRRSQKDIVRAAVESDGMALEFASETLRNDCEIVLAAVKSDGMALQFASETLRNENKIVFAAVKSNGMALQFASETLRNENKIDIHGTPAWL